MPFEPTLPEPHLKMLVIKKETSNQLMGAVSGRLVALSLEEKEVANLNTFYSFIENKHISIITYYE